MPEEPDIDERFNRYVMLSLVGTSVLLLILPMFFVVGKETAYSAYETGEDYQVNKMRETFDEEEGY